MQKKGLLIFAGLILLGTVTNKIAAQPKKLRTIVVDAGHGGKDIGARGVYENTLGSYEKNVTLAISLKLVDELKKRLPDVKIVATRTTDVYQDPNEKAAIANEANGDLFLCIHADSRSLKKGKRQIGSKTVTKYKITYIGKTKKTRKKISAPYEVEVPIYETFTIPGTAKGTSVYIFAAHKTSDKLKAIIDGQDEQETNYDDSYLDSRVEEWTDVFSILSDLKNIRKICFTRKTLSDIPKMKQRIIEIEKYCKTKNIGFSFLVTPARYYSSEKQEIWNSFFRPT